MPLAPNAVTLTDTQGDIVIGSVGDDAYLGDGVTGLGVAPLSAPGIQSSAGGVWGGLQVEGAQNLTVDAPWTDDGDLMMRLRALMKAQPNPLDVMPYRWAGFGWPGEHLMFVRPNGFEPTTDETAAYGGIHVLRLRFIAEDPTVYSAAPALDTTRTAATSHSFTATNAGLHTVPAGALRGAWQVVLGASTSVFSPWIEIGGRRVTWQGMTLAAGQTLTVTRDRRSIRGPAGLLVDGRARTPGELAAHWPVLAPGNNTVTLGAASGSFTVEWQHWSTW